jgi:F-box-like
MQRNSKGKVEFNRLPIEILLEVYSYLSPKDASSVSLVNKLSNQAAMDNWFWMRKFKQHFPHLFSELSKIKIISNGRTVQTGMLCFVTPIMRNIQEITKGRRKETKNFFP